MLEGKTLYYIYFWYVSKDTSQLFYCFVMIAHLTRKKKAAVGLALLYWQIGHRIAYECKITYPLLTAGILEISKGAMRIKVLPGFCRIKCGGASGSTPVILQTVGFLPTNNHPWQPW